MLTKKMLFAQTKLPYKRDPWIKIAKLNTYFKNVSIEQAKKCTHDKVGFAALVSRRCIHQCNSMVTRLPIGGLNYNWNWKGNKSCAYYFKILLKQTPLLALNSFRLSGFSLILAYVGKYKINHVWGNGSHSDHATTR